MQIARVPMGVRSFLSPRLVAALAATIAIAPTATRSNQEADQEVIDAFARRITADVATDGTGGMTAAMFHGDQLLWAQGFGWADPAAKVPAGVRTIYRTGSISKSFTAVLLADLVEEGTVELDDAVASVLPEVAGFGALPAGSAPVTFRQLASHTAGLIREPELEGAASGAIQDWGHKILLSIEHTRYFAAPGTEYRYSNIGFGVLGYALQRATGTSFMELVRRRIFEPLGMSSSAFIVGPGLRRRLAVGIANRSYVEGEEARTDTELPALEHAGRGYKIPNGGVYSTVGDLATFAAAVMGRTEHALLHPETRDEMTRPQTPPGSATTYGLGFSIDDVVLANGATARLVGHGGSVAGYTAHLVFDSASGFGVVLLRNYNGGATNLAEAANGLLATLLEAHAAGD